MPPDIITIEAVFDDSDIQTDYFARDRGIEEWFVCHTRVPGGKVLPSFGGGSRKAITEQFLRSVMKEYLPGWLRDLNWVFRKGEKYSMSDHPYGQLRVDGITTNEGKILYPSYGVGSSPYWRTVSLILTASWMSTFKMSYDDNDVETPIPSSLEEFRQIIDSSAQAKVGKVEENKRRVAEARAQKVDKTPEQLQEIFEGLNQNEKAGIAFALFPARLQDLTHNDIVGLMKLREEKGPRMVFDETVKKFRGEE